MVESFKSERVTRKRKAVDYRIDDVEDTRTASEDADYEEPQEAAQSSNADSASVSRSHSHSSAVVNEANYVRAAACEGFKPGAIVRVTVDRFITYEHVDFYLSPNLNMIIGPNGTGKSTFVCAVCLGLGGKPSVLGRAEDLSMFIKTGHTSSNIQIELCVDKQKSVVIDRVLQSNSKSIWKVNNTVVAFSVVQYWITKFNIQIDNLCQFLPQEKMASFARLTPKDLLIDTERAVGDVNLLKDHEQLIKLGTELLSSNNNVDRDAKELERIRKELESDRSMVSQYEFAQRVKKHKEFLTLAYHLALVHSSKARINEAKTRLEVIETNLRQLDRNSAKFKSLQKDLNEKLPSYQRALNDAQNDYKGKVEVLAKINSSIEQCSSQLRNKKRSVDELRSTNKTLESSIAAQRTSIAIMKSQLEEIPRVDEDDLSRIRLQRNDAQKNLTSMKKSHNELNNQKSKISRERRDKEVERDQAKSKLNSLQNVEWLKMEKLRQIDPETYRAVEVLRKHRHEFGDSVAEPPYLSMKILDERCQFILARTISATNMFRFCFANAEVERRFTSLLDSLHIERPSSFSINDRTPRNFPPPVLQRELQETYGLDDYLINTVEVPDLVKRMLCAQLFLHARPFTLGVADEVKISKLEHLRGPNGRDSLPITTVYDSTQTWNLKRSNYGRKAVTISSRGYSGSRTLPRHFPKHLEPDAAEIQRINTIIERIQLDIDNLLKDFETVCNEMTEIENSEVTAKAEFDRIESEYQQMTSLRHKRTNTERVLEVKIRTVDQHEKKIADNLTLLDNHQTNLLDLEKEIEESVGKLQRLVPELQTIIIEKTRYEMIADTALSELDHVNKFLLEEASILQKEKDEVKKEIHVHLQARVELKDSAKKAIDEYFSAPEYVNERKKSEALEIAKELSGARSKKIDLKQPLSDESNDILCESDEELNHSIVDFPHVIKAALNDLSSHTEQDQNSVNSFVERIRSNEILETELSSRLHNAQGDRNGLEATIKLIRARWEPKLDNMISKISHAFATMFAEIGCRGEVKLSKNDKDYKEWTIRIMVAFRSEASLQPLDGQRQSGGERALTTAMYLLSLQGLVKSPFRVVDEINQGMDPTNERIVHNKIVEIACEKNDGQYFLITPKLLQNLKYNEKMKVHTIYSGQFVPRHDGQPMSVYVDRVKRAKYGPSVA